MKTVILSTLSLLITIAGFAQCDYMKDYRNLTATIASGATVGQSVKMDCITGSGVFTSYAVNHQTANPSTLTLKIYSGQSVDAKDLRYTQTGIAIPKAPANNTVFTINLGGGSGDLSFEGGEMYTFTITTSRHLRLNGDYNTVSTPGIAYWPNNGGMWQPKYDYFHKVGYKATAKNVLKAGETLKAGERLTSANGRYILRMQEEDGNLCIYNYANGKQGGFVWGSMKYGFKNGKLTMQTDGNLVVYDGKNAAKWSSKTHPYFDSKFRNSANKPVKMVLENDGKLKLYTASGSVVWTSK